VKALVLWFGLVVLVGSTLMAQMQIYNKRYIMQHLWSETKWSSGTLVIFLVWSGLVCSGLALVWSCGKTNQSLPVFLMCSGFQAIALAKLKFTRSLITTGICGVVCNQEAATGLAAR
jgi:hypothetical protein